eukprot:TRINITY_DN11269_c0_g1_i6.p1 TRINITY_DN11269_c0_g1~~TRINITY_DN11269_c0_g1_i6.p1  ORF type:complete len:192 (-),score=29.92 TRINITY_DN11269_c0_g1_i6:103-678(-)
MSRMVRNFSRNSPDFTMDWFSIFRKFLGYPKNLLLWERNLVKGCFDTPSTNSSSTSQACVGCHNPRLLYTVLQTLISAENLIFEDYLHPDILWNSDQHVSFDVFVLKYNLAFEYQGEQHYHDLSRFYGMNSRFLLNFVRDEVKRVKCQNMGITLVVVPYWWNGQPDSLVRLISLVQPNFLGSFSQNLLNKC